MVSVHVGGGEASGLTVLSHLGVTVYNYQVHNFDQIRRMLDEIAFMGFARVGDVCTYCHRPAWPL